MRHSHDINGRSEINQDGTSHNIVLHQYLAGPACPFALGELGADQHCDCTKNWLIPRQIVVHILVSHTNGRFIKKHLVSMDL